MGGERRLTVVIPSWNRRELLRRCLESLERQSARPQVLVVDAGSTDGTAAMLAADFPDVRCHRSDRRLGFARAVNRGLDRTETPYVALLNNDTEADRDWVRAGLRALDGRPEYDFFASRMVNFTHRDRLDSAGDCYDRRGMPYKRGWGEPLQRYASPEPVLGASAGAAFYRRRLFQELGLLDEDFHIYLEDVEFSLRCQLAGHRCLYLPDAVVYHVEAASDPARVASAEEAAGGRPRVFYSEDRVYWISRNRWLLMCLYQPWRNLPYLVYGWVHSALFHLLKAGHFGAFLRGLGSAWLATPRTWKKRLERSRQPHNSNERICRLLREC